MNLFTLADGRRAFYQWDTGRQLIVHDHTCTTVHFCNGSSDCSLVCEVIDHDEKRVVNVPNILLQDTRSITAFAFVDDGNGGYTRRAVVFSVIARTKPDGYTYTEVELFNIKTAVDRAKAASLVALEAKRYIDESVNTVSHLSETSKFSASVAEESATRAEASESIAVEAAVRAEAAATRAENAGGGSGGNVQNGIPAGGKAGQFLCKKSDEDYDVEWADFVIPEQYGLVTYDQDKTITIT